jgi:hypothetical protein
MDRDYFQEALQTFNNGNWYLFKKDWTGEINAKIQELKDAEQAVIDKKASGKQKLKDLGLDDDEIKALMGA